MSHFCAFQAGTNATMPLQTRLTPLTTDHLAEAFPLPARFRWRKMLVQNQHDPGPYYDPKLRCGASWWRIRKTERMAAGKDGCGATLCDLAGASIFYCSQPPQARSARPLRQEVASCQTSAIALVRSKAGHVTYLLSPTCTSR